MKLSNIFKTSSPVVTNIVTILVTLLLFLEQNQTLIESILNGETVKSVNFQNVFAFIVLLSGIIKAFSAEGNTSTTKFNWKQVIIKPLVKFLVFLSRETEPTNNSSTPPPDTPVLEPTPITVPLANIISSTPAS